VVGQHWYVTLDAIGGGSTAHTLTVTDTSGGKVEAQDVLFGQWSEYCAKTIA
jgi:hypothetical protein